MPPPAPEGDPLEERLQEAVRRARSVAGRSAAEVVADELEQALANSDGSSDERLTRSGTLEELFDDLEAERRRYEHLFEFAPGAYLVTDGAGKILEANRPVAELLAVRRKFLIGKPLAAVLPLAERRRFREFLAGARPESRSTEAEFEVIPRGEADGRLVHMLAAGGRDEDGLPRIRWLLRDVTEERRRERELRSLTQRLDRRVAERTAELEAANREKDRLLEEAQAARKEAVKLLAEIFTERARFQGVVQQLPVGVIVLDAPAGNVLIANETATAIAGRPISLGEPAPPSEGLSFFRDDGSRYAASELPAARTLASGEEVRSEEIELRGPGRRSWLEVSSIPVRDRHGDLVSVIVVFADVTPKRRAQVRRLLVHATGEVLRGGFDTRRILRELALLTVPEFADWAAVDIGENGILRLASAHATAPPLEPRLPRPTDESLVVARVFETGEPIFHPEVDAELAEALGREAIQLGSMPRLAVSSYLAVPVMSRGKIVAAFSFGTENADRRLDEDDLAFAVEISRLAGLAIEAARLFEELEQERDRLGVIVDRFRDGVIAVSQDLRVELSNPAAQQLLGEDLVPGASLPEPWPGVVDLRAFARELFRARTAFVERLLPLEEQRTLELVGVPARGEAPAVIVVRDVSERERVERAEREFVANAAHELRTPLAAIASTVEALELGAKDDPANRDKFFAHLRRECDRLGRLTESLLVLARAQTRAESPPVERIDVRGLLEEVAAALDPKPGVAVEIDCRDGLMMDANRSLVEQALRGLADNASKFTASGRIELLARPANGAVVVRVRDTGPGIPAAERERIFGRFYRPTGPEREGFGLGLAIVQESVRAAGGTLDLMTRRDVGTSVRLTFPQAAPE